MKGLARKILFRVKLIVDLSASRYERVGALVGKLKAAGVPEHVRVGLEAKLGRDAEPRHHLAPSRSGEVRRART